MQTETTPSPAPTAAPARRFLVMTAAACMPRNCWGKYKRVAVVEIDPTALADLGLTKPKQISERARGVVRIVETWERQHVGTTQRSAFFRALAQARDLADRCERNAATESDDEGGELHRCHRCGQPRAFAAIALCETCSNDFDHYDA